MVKGIAELNRKLTVAISRRVEEATRRAMEKGAEELVAMMKRLAPFDEIRDSIGWTWGKAPKGSFIIARSSSGRNYETMRITVFASNHTAHWFERGTKERFQKTTGRRTGKITPHPFFFPSYRSLRRRIKSRVTREMKKAIQGMSQ